MSRTQRLVIVFGLNAGLVAGLVVTGVTAHSLAVLAAGGDYLLDAAGVVVALVAAPRGKRASSIAALINAGWLLVLELLVAAAAADRLIRGSAEVHGLPVLIVSAIAALVMGAGVVVLRGDEDDDDGERDPSVAAVLLDTLADAAAAAGVAATGAVILVTGSWYWLDSAVALIIAVVIAYHALALIRKVLARG